MEVKSGEGTVVVADRNRYSDECCNNRGWGSGWDAARGVTSEVAGVSRQVEGVGKEVLNNRFATERGLCDLGYKTNSDIRDSRDQMGAGFNRVMDRLCQMEHQQSTCCCEIKGLVRESENRLALQAERNHCEVMKGQQEIKCLIENTAKD